jgi:ubiquinone/menaquinone biosynthesis C-methylase UbiE
VAERIDQEAVGRRYADWFAHGLRGIGMRYVFSRRGLWLINTPYRRILAVAKITAGDRVLDLGCGIGNILIALAERIDFRVPAIGIDVSPTLIDIGRREIEKSGLSEKIQLQVSPATSLPFADESFDVVLTSHVIKHLDDEALAKTFQDIHRVLAPGGRFLLWEFKKSALSAPLFISARATGLPPTFKLRSEMELAAFLQAAHLGSIRSVPTGIFLVPPVPRIAMLAIR